MKIYITGAEGFIGSHLTEHFVKKGFSVKATVLYNSFNSWGWLDYIDPSIKKQIEIVNCDIRDSHVVKETMKGCDVVIHLAALIGIPYSYFSPESYIDVNVKGTLNLLQAARDCSIKKFIHTSTSEVYGTGRFFPMTENHPLIGQSPYSASKISADQLVLSFYNSFDLPALILRPFNTFGPRQSLRAIIPTIITQLLENKANIKLGDLTTIRDFTYVLDIVKGFEKALVTNNIFGEVINLGSQNEISIKNLVLKIAKLLEKKILIKEEKKRLRPQKSEVKKLLSSNKKAKKILKWSLNTDKAKYLDANLKTTIEWFKKNQKNFLFKKDLYNI